MIYSPEDLKKMSPEEREKILKKFKNEERMWKINKILIPTIFILFIIFAVTMCSSTANFSGSSSGSTNTCKSCGRTFEAGDSAGNYMNIAKTGMCKNCYNNYNWGKDAIGK